jgi:hypothetical protein
MHAKRHSTSFTCRRVELNTSTTQHYSERRCVSLMRFISRFAVNRDVNRAKTAGFGDVNGRIGVPWGVFEWPMVSSIDIEYSCSAHLIRGVWDVCSAMYIAISVSPTPLQHKSAGMLRSR